MKDLNQTNFTMIKFKLNLGKWLNVTGENLKGTDLAITLLFLGAIITLFLWAVIAHGLPKVQVLF